MSDCNCNDQTSLVANLKARARAIGLELAQLNATKLGGKPNTKQQDGGTAVDHVGYKKALYDELREIRATLQDLALNGNDIDGDESTGAFEFTGDYGAS